MPYIHSLPAAPTFQGQSLLGYNFGPLAGRRLDVHFIEVKGGHDTFIISRRTTRIFYVLSGSGCFIIDGLRHDVTAGVVVEIPPKVEYSYTGRMQLLLFSTPRWRFGNDRHTKWNEDVVGGGFSAPLPNASWRSRILCWRIFGRSPAAAFLIANRRVWRVLPPVLIAIRPVRRYGEFLDRLYRSLPR